MRIPGRRLRHIVAAMMATLLLILPVAGQAVEPVDQNPSALRMTGDLLVARPFMAAATVLGSIVFVVSLPFSALGGNTETAAQTLVVEPFKQTFFRCLGCVERVPDGELTF